MSPEMRDLLEAVRDAADPTELSSSQMAFHLVSIRRWIDVVVGTAATDATRDLPPALPQVIAAAADGLRSLAGR